MSDDENQLATYREQIDKADREIVRFVMERTKIAAKIGEQKRKEGSPVYRPDRERDVYNKVINIAHEQFGDELPLSAESLTNIYREIMSGSIAAEDGPAIAYMGPPASFSHKACRTRFGSSLREIPVSTIAEVFATVEAGRLARYGVVPVDNTTEGSVGLTLDLLLRYDLKAYAELYIRVRHNLLGHEKTPLDKIRKIYTNKIAMGGCDSWLRQSLPLSEIEIVETSSTAAAAQAVSQNRDGVAIASEMAAQTYNLEILAPAIQDNVNNITRFLVIGQDECPPTGDDKTSVICSVKDAPGSLHGLLEPFHNSGVNLARIESRASRRTYGDYNFFIDFLGHHKDQKIQEILGKVAEHTTFLKVLGSYPRVEQP